MNKDKEEFLKDVLFLDNFPYSPAMPVHYKGIISPCDNFGNILSKIKYKNSPYDSVKDVDYEYISPFIFFEAGDRMDWQAYLAHLLKHEYSFVILEN